MTNDIKWLTIAKHVYYCKWGIKYHNHWTVFHNCKPAISIFKIVYVLLQCLYYRKISNASRTLVGNKIVDHSDVVGASPAGAAPTTFSFSTWHLAPRDSAKKAARQYKNLLSVGIWCILYYRQYFECHIIWYFLWCVSQHQALLSHLNVKYWLWRLKI